eukprot:TRINITY_DN5099_c0_g1_i1.p1 TRINITY_DN5099_c0_g1~~TRINITY_DN5099_c0_g1_i1.p1  ORF type:complete len:205 (+),score=34.36 TRINITY_DN5099_c0_g1_i1:95-709(+)
MSILEHNGSSVIAMTGKNCVAIASDLRFGISAQTLAFDFTKVFQLTPRTFVGLPGLLTDCQTMHERLKYRVNMYRLREEREMTPKVLTKMVSSLLYQRRFGPYFVEPIIAGLDENDEPYITGMDLIGALSTAQDFTMAGTAAETMVGMAETLWRPDLTPEDLFEVISQTLMSSCDRDAISGWGAVVHVITPEKVITRHLKTRQD